MHGQGITKDRNAVMVALINGYSDNLCFVNAAIQGILPLDRLKGVIMEASNRTKGIKEFSLLHDLKDLF